MRSKGEVWERMVRGACCWRITICSTSDDAFALGGCISANQQGLSLFGRDSVCLSTHVWNVREHNVCFRYGASRQQLETRSPSERQLTN